MARRKIRVRYWRDSGHKTKKNKKSVAERKRRKNLLKKWKRNGREDLIDNYYKLQQRKAGYGI